MKYLLLCLTILVGCTRDQEGPYHVRMSPEQVACLSYYKPCEWRMKGGKPKYGYECICQSDWYAKFILP